MSLRIRLTLIISLLFVCSMLLGVVLLVGSARQRVANEVASSATLSYQLLEALLPVRSNGPPDDYRAMLESLQTLEGARHLSIAIGEGGNAALPQAPLRADAPAWFTRLVQGPALEYRIPLETPGGAFIVIRTNPADEITEVWQETWRFLLMLSLALLLLNGILYFVLGHWFRPVAAILGNLGKVEAGEPGNPLPARSLPELQVIARRVDRLGAALRASREENAVLQRRSLSIQEEERRNLAQELHDEMGQSISAIKAIAFSIAQRNADDAMSQEGAGRIVQISNHVRDHIRSMMQRLRPAVLDALGLQAALEVMVDEWNRNHTSCFCSLRVTPDPTPITAEVQIHLYRIAQEALTNVAAHAAADQVEISLTCGAALDLVVRDNGCGFTPGQVQTGMGLSGMQERVAAMRGTWQLDTAPGLGVTIRVHIPSRNDHGAR